MKVGFEWDEGNDTKNYSKHGVSRLEAESVFQDEHKLHFSDPWHSGVEERYITLGQSNRPRVLLVAWTLRKSKVRIISVRPTSRKERYGYEAIKKQNELTERNRYLTTDYGDVLQNAKPIVLDLEFNSPTQAISLRLPTEVLNKIRIVADEHDVPYQSLIKMWLIERLKKVA